MTKRKKRYNEMAPVKAKRREKHVAADDVSVEQTGLLYGDRDDVGRADKPTDYDDPDVCFQIAMNNPRA